MWIFRAVKASPVSFKIYLPTIIINPFVFITLLQSYYPAYYSSREKRLDNE